MNTLVPSDLHLELLEFVRLKVLPWRAMTVAIDGIDHSGKSSLARFLAWQLGMPALETDLFLVKGPASYNCDAVLLQKFVKMRHDMNRPVIVEGVFVLRSLKEASIEPEMLVRIESQSKPRHGSWPEDFAMYETTFPRAKTPDFRFWW